MTPVSRSLFAVIGWLLLAAETISAAAGPVTLHTRSRIAAGSETNAVQVVANPVQWDPSRTAMVVCDMWDRHHCPDATERVGEMAPRMNEVLKAARDRGMLIIHCPSDTMEFYQDHPGRKLAQAAPVVETAVPLQSWCSLDDTKEPLLPIDDTDGGCDGCPDCPGYRAWTRQHPALEIQEGDGITDSAEAFYLMRQRGITNVIVMGVHINMCVLGRPFSIRQMVAQGQNVVLMRDLTDSMYHHRMFPYVSHFRGTEMMVEHIEQYWCPSITSTDLLGGEPFQFSGDVPKRIVMIIGENEYQTEQTLPDFAKRELAWRGFEVSYVMASTKEGDGDFHDFERIRSADLVVVSARRRAPPLAMMDLLRAHLDAGKPLVGIRTASHAFDTKPASAASAAWSRFDTEILGAQYGNHYGNKPPGAPLTLIETIGTNASNLVLTGVTAAPFRVISHLYRYTNVASTVVPLLRGRVEGLETWEPVAWLNTARDRRVFYTSLGSPDDFQLPAFRRLLLNGILWGLHEPIPPALPDPVDYAGGWKTMRVPGDWEENSKGRLSRYDGFAWYRCRVELPDAWRGTELSVEVSGVDNAHETFANGIRIGSAGSMPPNFTNGLPSNARFTIAPEVAIRANPLWIAVRVFDRDGRGGFRDAAPRIHAGTNSISLAGTWDFRTGDRLEWAAIPATNTMASATFHSPAATPTPTIAPALAILDLPQEATSAALTPQEALQKFHVADDLALDPLLAEPEITQPVFLNFDERGRMWVVEYRQYPSPAGLTLVSRDSVWRAVYDKVPPPPPHHFRGADRISIHEDTNGDGTYDRHKVFVDGLNITTAVERGRGGVWVLNPPYLLFYPDANNDDIPDGDPEVRLAGFGLEDTHSVANSLRWGPDGWLYGAQGSTVTANIVVHGVDGKPVNATPIYSQGQNIWRYHPEKRLYEVFSEGGGNAFGCEIDSQGRIFSGHNGGDTRGFHYQQGAYLQKGFEKHGPLSNPYAFGYFPAMPHGTEPRFTHNFVIYDHGSLPSHYAGHLFGVEPIQGRIVETELIADQSSFRTRDLSRPITSDDRWFRPVDIKVGPDGALYICDWYDQQVNHYRNHEGQMDASNGRVYRIKAKGAAPARPRDLSALGSSELIQKLSDPNRWVRQTSLRLLADRKDAALIPSLTAALSRATGQTALETLWALNLCGGLTASEALLTLQHADPFVRLWTVRLLGDSHQVSAEAASRLAAMAVTEPDLEVRNQLAATARRLSAEEGLPIVRALAMRPEDATDNRQPLLLWWAIESQCQDHHDAVLHLFDDPAFWSSPLVESQLLERTIRRFAQAGSRQDLLACARLFELSPSPAFSHRLMTGFEAGFKGRSIGELPVELATAMERDGVGSAALALRRNDPRAVKKALEVVVDETAPRDERIRFLEVMGEVKVPGAVPVLSRAYRGIHQDDALRKAVLGALRNYDDPAIAEVVLSAYPALGPASLPVAQTLLASRPEWSRALAQAITRKTPGWSAPPIPPASIPPGVVRQLKEHNDPVLHELLASIWPESQQATTAEMDRMIRDRAEMVRTGTGDPYRGRTLFQDTCGGCHKLFGKGGEVGPDLTVYNRADLDSMLLAIVNPSAEVREGYVNLTVETRDGRSLSGFLADQDNQTVVLRGLDNQNVVLSREDIAELHPAGFSLMPEGLLDTLDGQQTRDLFAYLRSTQPLVGQAPTATAAR